MKVSKSTPAKAEKLKQKIIEKKNKKINNFEKNNKKNFKNFDKKPSFQGKQSTKVDDQNKAIKKYLKMKKLFNNNKKN